MTPSWLSRPGWLPVLLALAASFPLYWFPVTGPGDVALLDLRLHYSADEVLRLFAGLTADQREAYYRMATGSDLLFPLFYSLAIRAALILAVRADPRRGNAPIPAHWFPLLIIPADWGENLFIATLLHQYPDLTAGTVTLASLFTGLKWCLLATSLLLLLYVGIRTLLARMAGKRP